MGPAENKIARALLGGQAKAIAKAVLGQDNVKEAIVNLLLGKINEECTNLCKRTIKSPFHTIPVNCLASFKWKDMVQLKAPLLFTFRFGFPSLVRA